MAKKKKNKINIEKQIKKVNKVTLILVLVFAVLGIGAGFGTAYFLTRNDVFEVVGETEITLNVGDSYEELGAKAIAFGKDISASVEISGEVNTSKEGKYIITYTVNSIRFSRHKLYKLVNVVESEVE